MITVVGMWEPGYSLEQMFIEDTVWKQTLSAFAVDRFVMVTGSAQVQPALINPEQYETMAEALASCEGKKVFLTFPVEGATKLHEFTHPNDAVYIFGCPGEDLLASITADDHQVHMDTPNNVDLLACSCVAAVLYARSRQ